MITRIVLHSDVPTVRIEQEQDGVIHTKQVFADDLLELLEHSKQHILHTGLLPPGCLAATYAEDGVIVTLLCPFTRCTVTYYDTVYPEFPLPRLVLQCKVLTDGRLTQFRIGVIPDEWPRMDIQMYRYPFSNVRDNGALCVGANVFCGYNNLWKLRTLAHRIMTIPNNDDWYDPGRNRLGLGYRELLEHLKDREPAYYYDRILVPSSRTLEDFLK